MITINSKTEKNQDEFFLILKLFYTEDELLNLNINFTIENLVLDNKINTKVYSDLNIYFIERNDFILDENFPNRYVKRYSKMALYDYISKYLKLNIELPWGSLTGIRPTKLFYQLIKENNNNIDKAYDIFINDFKVSRSKANIVKDIINNQKFINIDEKNVDFYVNIPFCPSRCYYCSFISESIDFCKSLLEPYLDALIKEINETKKLIKTKNLNVKTIYIGGGTPTILNVKQLDYLLSQLDFDVNEFTVECGRPDTISKDKLDILKKYGVTRISVNPQTFSDDTLKLIGRKHTSNDTYNAYFLAKKYGFTINMDLIAGLSNENLDIFKNSVNCALDLNPDNITIHTLSVKNGSNLKIQGGDTTCYQSVSSMVEYSINKLYEYGYKPYYLYKQKNMIGNLENIGYFKENPCIFNINSMEEFSSILACGANAISKRYFIDSNRIERFANVKNISEYISRIDEMIIKKNKLFK